MLILFRNWLVKLLPILMLYVCAHTTLYSSQAEAACNYGVGSNHYSCYYYTSGPQADAFYICNQELAILRTLGYGGAACITNVDHSDGTRIVSAGWTSRPAGSEPPRFRRIWVYYNRECGGILDRDSGDCEDGPDKDICLTGSTGIGNPGIGNPCYPGSGNKYQRETDYASSGSNLTIVRNYNSNIAHKSFGMGYGWSNNFTTQRIKSNGLLDASGTDLAYVRSASGRSVEFTRSGTEWVASDLDTDITLSVQAAEATVNKPDGSVETYYLDGLLKFVTDAAGKLTSYSYNASNQLETVVYPFGHTFTLTWESNGQVDTIQVPHGGTYDYDYDDNDNLVRVTFPDTTFREYIYDDLNPGLEHHLTGIVDEEGVRYATFAYDPTSKKAVLTQHAITDDPQSRPQERYELQYE